MRKKTYKNPNEALRQLKKDIQKILYEDVEKVTIKHIKQSKQENVYGMYSPKMYRRRYENAFDDTYDQMNYRSAIVDKNKGSYDNYTLSMTVFDTTLANPLVEVDDGQGSLMYQRSINAHKPIASLLEFGSGKSKDGIPPMHYDFEWDNSPYALPRPYIEPLEFSLDFYEDIVFALKLGLTREGWTIDDGTSPFVYV